MGIGQKAKDLKRKNNNPRDTIEMLIHRQYTINEVCKSQV